ncbi:MAG: tetratricopeptide repeat protein [Planctomycetaceae bacterium]
MSSTAATFQQAVRLHRSGQLDEAARLYESVIRVDSRHADALHLRGVAAHQQNRHAEAANYIRRAIAINNRHAAYFSNLGAACRAQGEDEQAIAALRRATTLSPNQAEFHFNLGNALRQAGELDEACHALGRALELAPNFADGHNNLGSLLRELGRLEDAERHLYRALQVDPKHADAMLNLALVFRGQNRISEAASLCEQLITTSPRLAKAHSTLGLVRQSQRRFDEACDHYRRALAIDSDSLEAANNLGMALVESGDPAAALSVLQAALQRRPDSIELKITLAAALKSSGRIEEAIFHLESVLQSNPDVGTAWNNLGNCLKARGEIERAIDAYRRAIALQPRCPETHCNLAVLLQNEGEAAAALEHYIQAVESGASSEVQIRSATLLPPIYSSLEEMLSWRRRLIEQVETIHLQGVRVDPARQISETTFYLPYQGFNDRDIQEKIGRLYRSLNPAGDATDRRRRIGKLRVGFISRYFQNHTIGRLMRGMIAKLSRTDFEVAVISVGRSEDELAVQIRSSADQSIEIDETIPVACSRLLELELDVLIFTDIGMDPITYTLAHNRFAPIQCATWGHPVTTGLSTIDYFLSSRLFEIDDPGDHYSERLVRFDSPGVYYSRPEAFRYPASRAEFDLPDDRPLYGCPQSLFKLHPEFDRVLGEILRRDPRGEIVLLSGSRPNWNRLLLERLSRSIPDGVHRIRFVGRQNYQRFLQLNTVFDVLLDPIHFSGGNTSYEAFAFGVPVVTWPSQFLRGRITHGLYRYMGVTDCVATNLDEYVDIAIRLSSDRSIRAKVSEGILEAVPRLFEDRNAVREFEEFLQSVRLH